MITDVMKWMRDLGDHREDRERKERELRWELLWRAPNDCKDSIGISP